MFWRTNLICVVYRDLKKIIWQRNGINSCHFRANNFYNFRRELSQEYIDELISLFGDKAPSYSTVKNWFNEFNRGRSSLKDEFREGPTKTAVVPDNIDAVRKLITHRHVTYSEI